MHFMKRFRALACVAPALFCYAAHAACLTDLGTLPGYTISEAAAISADGKIIVGTCSIYENGRKVGEPFIWTAGEGMVGMGLMPDSTDGVATGVSTNGIVVGSCTVAGIAVGFKWTAPNGYVALTVAGSAGSHATAISADGEIVVGYTGAANPVKWNALNEATRPTSGPSWRPADISGDGSVIVGNTQTSDARALRWRSGEEPEYLDIIAGVPAGLTLFTAKAVTLDGQFIGGLCMTAPAPGKASIWSAATGLKLI